MHYPIRGDAGFISSHLSERMHKEKHAVTIFEYFNTYYVPKIKQRNIASIQNEVDLARGDIRDSILVERAFAKRIHSSEPTEQ